MAKTGAFVNHLKSVWDVAHKSVCKITQLSNGVRIASGTGFKAGRWIVTNNHVVTPFLGDSISIQFVGLDGMTRVASTSLDEMAFERRKVICDSDQRWDFSIMDINDTPLFDLPGLELDDGQVPITTEVALLGFQFDQEHLSVHSGSVSSRFTKVGVDYIQLDASVNNGNSGGPLISLSNGKVCGIVTRKLTGLTEQFDELMESFDRNVLALATSGAAISVNGVDPIQAAMATQQQLKRLAHEISRSANVGIGFAYDITKIREGINRLESD